MDSLIEPVIDKFTRLKAENKQLKQCLLKYQNKIIELSKAPTDLERLSRIEVLLADIEERLPADWAREYMQYTNTDNEMFF